MWVKEVGSRKKGHRPERTRLVSGDELGMAKRVNEAVMYKVLFTVITVAEFYSVEALFVKALVLFHLQKEDLR